MTEERRVPVQGDGLWHLPEYRHSEDGRRTKRPGTITWTEHVEIWEAYHKRWSGQDAETIARRGGFSYWEAADLLGHELTTWEPR